MSIADRQACERLVEGTGSAGDLLDAFKWSETPQGHNFWALEYETMMRRTSVISSAAERAIRTMLVETG